MKIRGCYIIKLIRDNKNELKYIKLQYNLVDGITENFSYIQFDNFRYFIKSRVRILLIFICNSSISLFVSYLFTYYTVLKSYTLWKLIYIFMIYKLWF